MSESGFFLPCKNIKKLAKVFSAYEKENKMFFLRKEPQFRNKIRYSKTH